MRSKVLEVGWHPQIEKCVCRHMICIEIAGSKRWLK